MVLTSSSIFCQGQSLEDLEPCRWMTFTRKFLKYFPWREPRLMIFFLKSQHVLHVDFVQNQLSSDCGRGANCSASFVNDFLSVSIARRILIHQDWDGTYWRVTQSTSSGILKRGRVMWYEKNQRSQILRSTSRKGFHWPRAIVLFLSQSRQPRKTAPCLQGKVQLSRLMSVCEIALNRKFRGRISLAILESVSSRNSSIQNPESKPWNLSTYDDTIVFDRHINYKSCNNKMCVYI